ncbi:hypothetical protein CHUAL_007341 [Chamberlinius hualienensis]
MCGIWAIFGSEINVHKHFANSYHSISHRGPNSWKIESDRNYKNGLLGFHRLAIVDDMRGAQPMRLMTLPHIWVICNGELYNCKEVGKEFNFPYESGCDIESIIHLYNKEGIDFCASHLDGVFAFCLVDIEKQKIFIARDTYGVRPAYKMTTNNGILGVCSEIKGLIELPKVIGECKTEAVAPGHIEEYNIMKNGKTTFVRSTRFHRIGDQPKYTLYFPLKDFEFEDIFSNIRNLLTAAVKKRLMSQRRIGCFLSGGLDSSLLSAILIKLAAEENFPYRVQTFSIGLESSPDIIAAKKVSEYIDSEHHELIITENDIINSISKVIYHLESYDITTVRSSIGLYLLSQFISKTTDTIVIFSGEGSDEVTQGYIYFRNAPSAEEADREHRRLLEDIHYFDVLRSDKMTAAHGLEVRVPFLDHQFSAYYLSLPTELRRPKNGVEKYLLRKAFDGTNLLPDEILWRQKEAFSDGMASVKKSLYTVLQQYAESQVTDEQLFRAKTRYLKNPPLTKEALYYREMFQKYFPGQDDLVPYFWMPRWCNATDPSARFISHYKIPVT